MFPYNGSPERVCLGLILFVYGSTPRGRFCLFFFLRFIEIVFVFLQFEAKVFAYFLTTFVYFHLSFLTQHYTEYLEDSAGFLINI